MGKTKSKAVIATAAGFAPNTGVADAINCHKAAYAAVRAVESTANDALLTKLCRTECNALRAVSFACCTDVLEAMERAVYLADYWEKYGGAGEGDAAYPSLYAAIQSLRQFM